MAQYEPCRYNSKDPDTYDQILDLWYFLKHGDSDHQEWLLDAIEAWFNGEQIRPPIG